MMIKKNRIIKSKKNIMIRIKIMIRKNRIIKRKKNIIRIKMIIRKNIR